MLRRHQFIKVELADSCLGVATDLVESGVDGMIMVDHRLLTPFLDYSMRLRWLDTDTDDYGDGMWTRGAEYDDSGFDHNIHNNDEAFAEDGKYHRPLVEKLPYFIIFGHEQVEDFCKLSAVFDHDENAEMPLRQLRVEIKMLFPIVRSTNETMRVQKHLLESFKLWWWGFGDLLLEGCIDEEYAHETQVQLSSNKWDSTTDMLTEVTKIIHTDALRHYNNKEWSETVQACDRAQCLILATLRTTQRDEFQESADFPQEIIKLKIAMYHRLALAEGSFSNDYFQAGAKLLHRSASGKGQRNNAQQVARWAINTVQHVEEGLDMIVYAKDYNVTVDPKLHSELYMCQFMALMTLGKFDEAEKKAEMSLRLAPDGTKAERMVAMGDMRRMMQIMRGWGPALTMR